MNINEQMESPKEIYGFALNRINQLVDVIIHLNINEEKLEEQQSNIEKQLIEIQNELDEKIISLQDNSEWERFSIAFYGETNAGKSTIIETLRILFNEAKKVEERKMYATKNIEFQELNNELKATNDEIEKIKAKYKDQFAVIKENLDRIVIERMKIVDDIERLKNKNLDEEIEELREEITAKRNSSIKNFFLWLFKKLDEQKEIAELKKQDKENKKMLTELLKKEKENDVEKKSYELKREESEKSQNIETKEKNNLKNELEKNIEIVENEREKYCDGKIIGDGHSDFTKDTTAYELEHEGEKFSLLDLPGIEGNEKIVRDDIEKSLKRTHAVFYVSSSATPPQNIDTEEAENGNSGKLGGTIKKIKEHLGDQTEVYYLFNKKIKNPIQLDGDDLINSGEKAGLGEIEAVMSSVLGEQFKNCISLSAYPAFLTEANCMERDRNPQKKFLEFFKNDKELLMKKSYMQGYIEWLSKVFVKNTREKIRKANFKKVYDVIEKVAERVEKQGKIISSLKDELEMNKKATEESLDLHIDGVNRKYNSTLENALVKFQSNARRDIYGEIDRKIDNDTFKYIFKDMIEKYIEEFGKDLESDLKQLNEKFEHETKEIMDKYNKTKKKFIDTYTSKYFIGDLQLDMDIDIKNDVDMAQLLFSIGTSIVGAVIAITNPAGWVVLGLAIISGIVSIVKSIWGAINHSYRASRQKEQVDAKLDEIRSEIEKDLEPKFNDIKEKISGGIDKIKEILTKDMNEMKKIEYIFENTNRDLDRLSYEIKSKAE